MDTCSLYADTPMLNFDKAQLAAGKLGLGFGLKCKACVCLDQTPIIGKIFEVFRIRFCCFDLQKVANAASAAADAAALSSVAAEVAASSSAAAAAAVAAAAVEIQKPEIFKQLNDFADSYPNVQHVNIPIVEGDENCVALKNAIQNQFPDYFELSLHRPQCLTVTYNPSKITYSKELHHDTDITYFTKSGGHLFKQSCFLNDMDPQIQYIEGMQINTVCNPQKLCQLLTDKLGGKYIFSLKDSAISVSRSLVSSAYFGECEIQPGQHLTEAGEHIQNMHKEGNAIVSLLVTNNWLDELGHVFEDAPYNMRSKRLEGQTLFESFENEVFNHGRISATCLKSKQTSNVGVELYEEGVVGVMFDVVDKTDTNRFREGVLATALKEYNPWGSCSTKTSSIYKKYNDEGGNSSLQKLKQTMNDPTHDNFKTLNEVIILNAMKKDLCGLIIDRKAWEKCDDAKQKKSIGLIHEFKEISGLDLSVFMYDHVDNSLSEIAVCSKQPNL